MTRPNHNHSTPPQNPEVKSGDLVFYFCKNYEQNIPPVHVAIAICSEKNKNKIMLLHALPEKNNKSGHVAETDCNPSNHYIFSINPWHGRSDMELLTDHVITLAKRFTPSSPNYIPIEYSHDRLEALEKLQNAAIPCAGTAFKDTEQEWKRYTQKIIDISTKRYFGKDSENEDDYNEYRKSGKFTIMAKVSNLNNHLTKPQNQSISKGMHCSQFVLMILQMAYEQAYGQQISPRNNNKKKKFSRYYLSRKHGSNDSGKKKHPSSIYEYHSPKYNSQPGFLQKEAKSISPAGLWECICDPTPPGPSTNIPTIHISFSTIPPEVIAKMFSHMTLQSNNPTSTDEYLHIENNKNRKVDTNNRKKIALFELCSVLSNLLQHTKQIQPRPDTTAKPKKKKSSVFRKIKKTIRKPKRETKNNHRYLIDDQTYSLGLFSNAASSSNSKPMVMRR